MTLADLGWDSGFETEFEPHRKEGLVPARIATRHRTAYEILAELGELGAQTSGRLHSPPSWRARSCRVRSARRSSSPER